MQSISNYLKNPRSFFDACVFHFGQWLPDSTYIKLRYRFQMHRRLNLKNPRTFQEKLQWLKLHDQNPEYTKMVDKVLVKDYVAAKIGGQYVVPILGVWDKPEEIDWESLPNRFVLKTNHSGGNSGVVICHDKTTFDRQAAINKLNYSLKGDVYKDLREWPYKNIARKVFAEQFIEAAPDVKDLPDYKWYCFNGEPEFCQVIQNRTSNETIDFFDIDWNHQDFVGLNEVSNPVLCFADKLPERPNNLETQVRIARELSSGIPYARIDLYETKENVYFGEVTFYPMSGMGVFTPEQYDEILGKMLVLPGEKRGGVIIKKLQNNELVFSEPDLQDYKFFCFDGEVKALFIASDRQNPKEEVKFDFFDADFNHLPLRQGHPNASVPPEKPRSFEEMKQLAAKLSKGIPHVRVDLYEVNGHPLFGEMTFCHFAAMMPFEPEEWDVRFGNWLDIEKINRVN